MNKKLSLILAAAAAVLLSGCAAFYTLEGQRYNSAEEFQRTVDSHAAAAVAAVAPLPSPLTKKKLIFAIPAEATVYQENVRRSTVTNGRAPTGLGAEMVTNLTRANYKMMKVFYDVVQKKGIYPSVQFMDMPSMAISLEPSADTDVVYYAEPSQGTGQWFYASAKSGRQVFAYDRSGAGPTAKALAFIDAVQAQAIRE